MTFVFMIAPPTRVRPRLRRQVGSGAGDCLDARLLVVGDDRDVRLNRFGLAQNRHFAIDAQHFRHLLLKRLVAAFEVVANLVRLHVVLVEDLADRALRQARQTGMPGRFGRLPDVSRQQSCRPKLVRISHLLGLLAGQRHHPCAGSIRKSSAPCQAGGCRQAPTSRQTAPHDQGTVERSDGSPRSPHRRRRSTGWRDTPAGSVPVEPDTPTPFATVRSPPTRSSQSLRSQFRLPAEVLPSYPAVMLAFPADYSMWGPLGNRPQQVGSMESMY